jgi:hypothetical protein
LNIDYSSERKNIVAIYLNRSDGEVFSSGISVARTINRADNENFGFIHPDELINKLKELESYRNCECPNNPECHKIINNKLDIITAKG